jgi:hypothetical protein
MGQVPAIGAAVSVILLLLAWCRGYAVTVLTAVGTLVACPTDEVGESVRIALALAQHVIDAGLVGFSNPHQPGLDG